MVFQAALESQIRLELLTHLSQILGGKLVKFMHNIKYLSQVGFIMAGPLLLAGLGQQAPHCLGKKIGIDKEQ